MKAFASWKSRCNRAGSNDGTTAEGSKTYIWSSVFYGNVVALESFYIEAQFSDSQWGYYPAKQIRYN